MRRGFDIIVDGDARTGDGEALPQFEALVRDLASACIDLDPAEVDRSIETCLRSIVEALGLDRSTLFQLGSDGDMRATHSWARPGFSPLPTLMARRHFPWALDQIMAGESFCFARVDDLPDAAATDKASIRLHGPRSNMTFPLAARGQVFGALCFGAMAAEYDWPAPVRRRLDGVAQLVAMMLERRRVDQELRAALTEVERLRERVERENAYLRTQARSLMGETRIIGHSTAIQRTLALVEQVAPTDATVLITGETGVGKELIAEAVHAASARAAAVMVKLNCAALPSSLVEAELFGREKGAYTGALTQQIGRFELANGSTLFLDEVSELSLELQAKLLRVLQAGEFERLGSPRTLRTDVRIIAASNRDLEQAVADGGFRADLYYRLAVFPIAVPPLRSRPDDIAPLVRAIVDEVASKMGRRVDEIDDESLGALRDYAWPGNVRELRNVVERALILGSGTRLYIETPKARGGRLADSLRLEDVERSHILRTLESTGWRVRGPAGAGAVLGMPPTTLETRMAKLGIRRPT